MAEQTLTAFPAKIKIGGLQYEVTEVECIKQNGQPTTWMGGCHYDDAQISLLSTIGEERKRQVLVHEMVHAMLNEAGYCKEGDQNEDQVERLGIVLHQVLQDNDFSFLRR